MLFQPLEARILFTRFAIAGDFAETTGFNLVSAMMEGWNPAHIISLGDNNNNDDADLEGTIGAKFHEWMDPYLGSHGAGSTTGNRFWPILGNHDWDGGVTNYTNYFTLPNNERYYSVVLGEVEWFMLDSDTREPDGTSASSTQGQWLQSALAASTAPWQIVTMHHPPYSSATTPDNTWMRWPFEEWGADVIMSGHDHLYERLNVSGLPAFIVGTGGGSLHSFETTPRPDSQFQYDSNHGAMQLDASDTELAFKFYNRNGALIDSITLNSPSPPPPPTPPLAPTALVASAASNTKINLTWTDNSSNETGFRIERSIAGQGFVEIGTVPAGVTSFSNTNLSGGTGYAYRVRAYNTSFTSSYTNSAAATTPATALPTPWLNADIGAVGAAGSATAINGVYTINASGANVWGTADSFNYVYRSWTGDGQIFARANLPADGFDGIMFRESLNANSKQASVLIDDDRAGFVRRTTTGGTSTSNDVAVSGLQYLKLIRAGDSFTAYRSANGSSWTQIGGAINIPMASTIFVGLLGCATDAGTVRTFTMDNVNTSVSTAVTPTLPAAPSGLGALAVSASQINVSWTDGSSNDDGFKIERRVGFGAWIEIASVGAGVTSYASNALASSTGYSYRVRAFNNLVGNSTYSNIAATNTLAGAMSPLIPAGSSWKYLDNGVDQTTAWRGLSFDDSAWASGGAQLGYGDGDENTNVSYGPNPLNRYITTYFRKSFNVADPSQIGALSLGLLRDDGAVVYLNGSEVFRSNMPEGTIGYSTLASSAVNGADETTYFAANINRAVLVGGTNVIAVEIHQRAASDADVSFDLQLTATASNPALAPSAPSGLTGSAVSATQVKLTWIDSATTEAGFSVERSADGLNFAEIQSVAAGVTSYIDNTVSGGVQYWYRVRAYNAAGASSFSGPATMTTPVPETLEPELIQEAPVVLPQTPPVQAFQVETRILSALDRIRKLFTIGIGARP